MHTGPLVLALHYTRQVVLRLVRRPVITISYLQEVRPTQTRFDGIIA
jgi:hypothetical protein